MRLLTECERSVQRRFDQVADVVVDVGRLVAPGRDLVGVDIEDRICEKPETGQSGLFLSLAQRNAGDIAIAVAMAAGLKPFVQLGVMGEQRMGSFGIDDPGRSSDMADLERPLETVYLRPDEIEDASEHRGFMGVEWHVALERSDQRRTRRKLSISSHAFSPAARSVMNTIEVASASPSPIRIFDQRGVALNGEILAPRPGRSSSKR